MTFNSITFAFFAVVVLGLYWGPLRGRQNPVLLAASYVFYAWWDWRFLSLIVVSTLVDFTVGRRVGASAEQATRKRWLTVSLCVNLTILGVFKYANFFIDSFDDALGSLGLGTSGIAIDVLLPVGISFYTFQTISYSFDVYRGRLEPTQNLLDFAVYVAYFPQLVAGPIERATRLLPQISVGQRNGPVRTVEACRLILGGLVKKVVIADGIAGTVDEVFGSADSMHWTALIIGSFAFALQIYGDFSGYTDIARGVSQLLGIELVRNFTQPYLSRNITEFWRRWHISLSDWLREYLYIPLGGNRGGRFNTYRNLLLTMLLGGLWHGAAWTFVIWGALHGLFLAAHRSIGGAAPDHEVRLSDAPRILGTFTIVLVAWVFFRADSIGSAFDIIVGIVTLQSGASIGWDIVLVVLFGVVMLAWDLAARRVFTQVERLPAPLVGVGGAAAVLSIVLFAGGEAVPFVYFQF